MTDDPLAQTATAQASAASPLERTLGRYAIERELGAGGMGVVHAAFDPDLERRVALKVLRDGIAKEAEQRLLREARAMARLAHANVVAVYEVGTAGGRDFIAMELIDGGSLVEWLRAERRKTREIVAAFVEAGRGLAAAHAAGIVHRDFKPHNVLRGRNGRIAVTDFGLAREAGEQVPGSPPPQHAGASSGTPSTLSGLTVPGALLGTPAYMAPEQWEGATATPASDQFAFCVAVWEALAGARPFAGSTVELLHEVMQRGPAKLDASKIPWRLRRVLRRGLEPDPAKRWPSMDALLKRLVRNTAAPRWLIGLSIAISVISSIISLSVDDGTPSAPAAVCEAPELEPAIVWSAANAAVIRAGSPVAAEMLDGTVARWRAARAEACTQPDAIRRRQLACLDRVLVRVDALRRARLLDLDMSVWGIVSQGYEPDVCTRTEPPKLPERYSDAAVVGLALRSGAELSADVIAQARAAAATDACAAAYLAFLGTLAGSLRAAEESRAAAQRCGDEQASGAAALNVVNLKGSLLAEPDLPDAIRDSEQAVARAGHPFLTSQFETFRAELALRHNRLDDAIAHFDAATAGTVYPLYRIHVAERRLSAMLMRGAQRDLERVRSEVAASIPVARTIEGDRPAAIAQLSIHDALAQWLLGDVRAAHPRLVALPGRAAGGGRRITGLVVDARGVPVGGASVAVGTQFVGDAVGIEVPLREPAGPVSDAALATTDRAGRFVIEHAPETGMAIAQRGAERSIPVALRDGVRLALEATTTVRGRVSRGAAPTGSYRVSIISTRPGAAAAYELVAPVMPDGAFELAGVVRGPSQIAVRHTTGWNSADVRRRTLVVGAAAIDGLALELPPRRALTVLVRSTSVLPFDVAYLYIFDGTVRATKVMELPQLSPRDEIVETARAVTGAPPAAAAALFRRGDLLAIPDVPRGAATVCIEGIQIDRTDEAFWTSYSRVQRTREVRCRRVAADASAIVIELPPMKRLDTP